jgi:tetratricopeptide (TPR) repeat protein
MMNSSSKKESLPEVYSESISFDYFPIEELTGLPKKYFLTDHHWMLLGDAYRNKKEYDLAEDAYKKAIDMKPENEQYYVKLLSFCIAQGKHKLFEDTYFKGMKNAGNKNSIIYMKGRLFFIQGNYGQALDSVNTMLTSSQIDDEFVYVLGVESLVNLAIETSDNKKQAEYIKIAKDMLQQGLSECYRDFNLLELRNYLEKPFSKKFRMDIDLTKIDLYLMRWRDNYYFGQYKDGSSNYFVLKEDNSGWDIIPYGSEKWNSLDQQCWKGHDIKESFGEGCSQKYAPDWLPPIPSLEEVKAVKGVKWKDNFKGKGVYPAEEMPNLKKYFEDNAIKEKELFFALIEDKYESCCGDGVFRDLKKISFNKEEIDDYIKHITAPKPSNSYGYEGYLIENTIAFDGKYFTMPDFSPGTFEHFKQDDLMQVAEELADEKAIKFFKPKIDTRNGIHYTLTPDGKLYVRVGNPNKKYSYLWEQTDENMPSSDDYFSYSKYEYEKISWGTKFEESKI